MLLAKARSLDIHAPREFGVGIEFFESLLYEIELRTSDCAFKPRPSSAQVELEQYPCSLLDRIFRGEEYA
jgi:hypothetical protein